MSEAADYSSATNKCAPGKVCGHYTQVVWRNTTHVGCATAICTKNSPFGAQFPTWQLWVCNYTPPGNFVGKPFEPADRKQFRAFLAGVEVFSPDALGTIVTYGDSITEQKMYSRIIEDYLTMCAPELGVTVRQYGWSGERAPGFLGRMTNDVLRFNPTVATTCYGMNDHEYRTFEDRIGDTYRSNSLVILRAFDQAGGNYTEAARLLGLHPNYLHRVIRDLDLKSDLKHR